MILNVQAEYPQSHTYVLKLRRDAAPLEGRFIGRLEHVASGHQLYFHSADELIACLVSDAGFADASEGSQP